MGEIKGGEILVKCLLKEGVRYVFGIPGDQLNPFTDAIYRLGKEAGLQFITTRHEQAAAHMADAWARITGEVGVCAGTVGPGAADLVPGVYAAFADSIPILVITAQNQTWRIYPEHGSMQSLDQLNLFRPITKWNAVVYHWRRIPQLVQMAFRIALSGRPGPVHLDFPSDVLTAKGSEEEIQLLPPSSYRAEKPACGDPELVREAARWLAEAQSPLIHAGGGVLRSGAWEELRELAEYLGAAVTTSPGARGAIPEDHPLCILASSFGAMAAQASADVVLLVGGRLGDIDFWGRPPAWGEIGEQKWIQIDIAPENIALNRPVDLAIVGDARATLRALFEEVKKLTGPRPPAPFIAGAKEAEQAWLAQFEEMASREEAPIHPLRLVKEVRLFFPREAITVVDGGNTAVWSHYLNRVYEPRSFLWAADSGHLGAGLPYAIAAKLARPERPVYLLSGDGAFGFNIQELETARRLGTPITAIVFNDGAWGMIKGSQLKRYDGRFTGVDFVDIRYDKIAEAMGCYGERVEDPDQIRPALERAQKSGLPAVLDVIIDREAHLTPPDLEVLDALWMEGCY